LRRLKRRAIGRKEVVVFDLKGGGLFGSVGISVEEEKSGRGEFGLRVGEDCLRESGKVVG
jgi:hypothetical protein